MPDIIQSLWIGKSLSMMEQLSMRSFIGHGHPYHLYTYGPVENVPEGVEIRDANAVIPESGIFKYPQWDSYAAFANLFRYRLVFLQGGYWCDTDMICLRPFSHDAEYVFSAQHHRDGPPILVNNGVIKAPAGSPIMEYCYTTAASADISTLKWGQTGPSLVNKAVQKFELDRFVCAPEVFCPVPWYDWQQIVRRRFKEKLLRESDAVHLWNEMWRRNDYDKNKRYPRSSLYERLKARYLR